MEQLTDAELARLVASASAQARSAESELCRRFAPRVRLYGLKHLRDEDLAADLIQSVLIAVLGALRANRVDDLQRIDRFVLGTCRFVAARMRQQSARVPLAAEEAIEALTAPSAERIDLGALYRCLNAIEERARLVLTWSFLEERSTDAIANSLSLQPGNVRVLRHRALAAVRRCLDARRGPEP